MVTLRIAAAFLLSGWLLMQPPLDRPPNSSAAKWKVVLDVPIRDWEQVRAFDSAEACESERLSEFLMAQESIRMSLRTGLPLYPVFSDQAYRSRCIPADHIYPPKKPGN